MPNRKEAPRWYWLLLGAGILTYVVCTVGPMVYVHYYGKETLAEVTGESVKTEGAMEQSHQVAYISYQYDGHTASRRGGKSRAVVIASR